MQDLHMNGKSDWLMMGASVIGHSHQKLNIPCQDSHSFIPIHQHWGLALVADGAGSGEHAHLGSSYLVEKGQELFTQLIQKEKWAEKNRLPEDEEWSLKAHQTLLQLKMNLVGYAQSLKTDLKELSSTLIVLIYQPQGLLVAHVGDGRGGYCGKDRVWRAFMRPWRGEYANETIFMSSDIWDKEDIKSFIPCRVIRDEVVAFSLLSDGCERHSFICNVWDEHQKKYYDPNHPFDKFFNPITQNLISMHQNKLSQVEIQEKWAKFLSEGNTKLKNEPDDKTMVVGVLNPDKG